MTSGLSSPAQEICDLSPALVSNFRAKDYRMHETSARTWCSGKTWRERVEREVGAGIGMGKTCKLKAVSFQCMTKFTTN